MSAEKLNRFLSAANDFEASDLHLITGVPPAYRVNGEIIIADADALTQEDVTAMLSVNRPFLISPLSRPPSTRAFTRSCANRLRASTPFVAIS